MVTDLRNSGIVELRNSGITEGQGKSNIAPTFSKRGYIFQSGAIINMTDAREPANGNFPDINYISEKDFQLLLAVKISHALSPHCALGHLYQQRSKIV